MITGFLKKLGLFVGDDLLEHYESEFFFRRNETILNSVRGGWDNPLPVRPLMQNKMMRRRLSSVLLKDTNSLYILPYLGLTRYLRCRSVSKINFSWGWKDARNTFTLPAWLDVFPKAKILHIYRNGVDVAQSLRFREQTRIQRFVSEVGNIKPNMLKRNLELMEKSLFQYIIRKLRSVRSRLCPLRRYKQFGVSPVINMERAFMLWTQYVSVSLECQNILNNDFLNIKYEDLFSDSEKMLESMCEFCDLSPKKDNIISITSSINKTRCFAFIESDELRNFYKSVKSHPLMDKLGYSELLK